MSHAKIPDDKNDWQFLDIFLFSNGQQYTPPRKYHLRTEELNWWKATLNFLAKSQYGSMHSVIELYTIDGQKVEGPMQLSDGAAYVAVVPPDAFIDSGYEKYLLKASRSWEKRQARSSSIIEVIKQGDLNNQQLHSGIDVDVANRKLTDDIVTLKTIVPSNFEDQVSTIIKPRISSNLQQNKRKSMLSSIKPIENKKQLTCQQTAMLKTVNKVPPMSPSASRKSSIKRKYSPPKRIIKVPGKANERTSLVSDLNKNRVTEKPKPKENKPLVPELSKVEETSIEKTFSLTKLTTSNHKNLLTNNTDLANTIENKETVEINLFRNQNSEIPSVIVDTDGKPLLLDIPDKGETISKLHEPVQLELPINTNQAVEKRDMCEDKNSSKIKIFETTKSSHLSPNNIVVINKPTDEQYIAIVNKGDSIKLKLKIEISNADDKVTKLNKSIRNTHSFSSIFKTEKGSQVNIEDEVFLQSKSLQSILANEYGNEDNAKVVIVHCSCCEQHNSIPRIDTTPFDSVNKKYVVLVPSYRNEPHPIRCKCDDEIAEKEIQKCDSVKRISSLTPIKKTVSEISLERLTKTNEASDITEFIITRENIAVPVSMVSSNTTQIVECERKEYVVTKRVAIDETQDTKPEYLITKLDSSQTSEEPQKTEFIVIRKNNRKTLGKYFTESFTQTEWCSILLEARRHDDGRYSFHLPPLHVLKHYKLGL